ncbi:hypothetical protein [Providencia sp. PROV267]|uniref:hypothetical protein n=1 Tax=Providencia sp. PROV267 TaxID=2949955 RepID=UPI0023498A31|nr:hypothetical protein [Providencia sp. PROV267]
MKKMGMYLMRIILYQLTVVLMFYFCDYSNAQGVYRQNIITDIVTPPSCEIIPPNNGNYQFSQLHAHYFKLNKVTALPELKQTWQVMCNTPINLFLKIIDNRHDSSRMDDESYFGLGNVNGSGKIGDYRLTLSHANVDNEKAELFLSENLSGTRRSAITVKKNRIYGWLTGESHIASGKLFSVDITVSPKLNSLKETHGPIVNGAELDGNAELIFSFGI